MLNWLKRNFTTLIGFAIIALVTAGSLYVVRFGWEVFIAMSETARVTLILGFVSLVGTLYTLRSTRLKDRQLQLDAVHTAKKQKVYTEFTKNIFKLLIDPQSGDNPAFLKRLKLQFMPGVFQWAGPNVIKSYHAFRLAAQRTDDELILQSYIASMIMAFREDLGLSNKGLNETILLEIMHDREQIDEYTLAGDIAIEEGTESG